MGELGLRMEKRGLADCLREHHPYWWMFWIRMVKYRGSAEDVFKLLESFMDQGVPGPSTQNCYVKAMPPPEQGTAVFYPGAGPSL